ncbi:MAG: inorganic diphosphatase [Actinomycetota bacterium]|nr:inorganic diphosphatase [Actinomycetota bacterium]MDQ3640033.1 inorganic diphosphatase [Actinomycetota bacterium]
MSEERARDAGDDEDVDKEVMDVFVETPKGSRKKYEHDHELDVMRLDRRLASATLFPSDYGYVPDTAGNDGEALDALVLADEPTDPGTMVSVRPVGVFWLKTDEGPEAKIIAVPHGDPVWVEIEDIDHVPNHLKAEIENFFEVYKQLEAAPHPTSGGYEGRAAAVKAIADARARFRES